MRLQNVNGNCLKVVLPQAPTIAAGGNNTVEVFIDPSSPPDNVDISGFTSWGPKGRSPVNTRLVLQLSQLQTDGDRLRPFVIQGRLPYVVPKGAFGVVVYGCGARKLKCLATDASGRPMCRFTEACRPSVAAAKANMLDRINSNTCIRPDP